MEGKIQYLDKDQLVSMCEIFAKEKGYFDGLEDFSMNFFNSVAASFNFYFTDFNYACEFVYRK